MNESGKFWVRVSVYQFGGGGVVRKVWFDGWWPDSPGEIAGGDAAAFADACAFYTRLGFIRLETFDG